MTHSDWVTGMIQVDETEAPGRGLSYYGVVNVMVDEAALDDFGLEMAIDALKRVSVQEQEAAILELDQRYPGIGN